MKAIQATLAATLLAAAGLASAAPAYEGGEASQGLTFEPVAGATQAQDVGARATTAVALEGGQASQGLTFEPAAAAQRTRAEVRAEGRIAARAEQHVYEGGQAS
jgi:hypothetical protein